MMNRRCSIGVVCSLFVLGACSPLDPGDDTWDKLYTPDEWRCIPYPNKLPAIEPGRVSYTAAVIDFNSQPSAPTPVADLTIKVCTNAQCEPEFARCADGAVTDRCVGVAGGPVAYAFDFPFGFSNAPTAPVM